MKAKFALFNRAVLTDHVKKVFSNGSYYHAFTKVDSEFPLEGDALKARAVLAEKSLPTIALEIKNESKTVVRKLLKQWEVSIGASIGIGDK